MIFTHIYIYYCFTTHYKSKQFFFRFMISVLFNTWELMVVYHLHGQTGRFMVRKVQDW